MCQDHNCGWCHEHSEYYAGRMTYDELLQRIRQRNIQLGLDPARHVPLLASFDASAFARALNDVVGALQRMSRVLSNMEIDATYIQHRLQPHSYGVHHAVTEAVREATDTQRRQRRQRRPWHPPQARELTREEADSFRAFAGEFYRRMDEIVARGAFDGTVPDAPVDLGREDGRILHTAEAVPVDWPQAIRHVQQPLVLEVD